MLFCIRGCTLGTDRKSCFFWGVNLKVFPSAHEALVTAVILSFMVGVCVSGSILVYEIGWVEYASALATLIAAFSGAWLAFHLANRDRVRQESERQVSSINKALFILMRQINVGELLGRDIDFYTTDAMLAFSMPASKANEYADLRIDFDGLAFLLSTEYVQEILHLSVEQERFEQMLESVKIRNDHYKDVVMPEMMAAGLTDRIATLKEYEDALSKKAYSGAIQGAKQIRSVVGEYRVSSMEMFEKLRFVAKRFFPDRRFLKIEMGNAGG